MSGRFIPFKQVDEVFVQFAHDVQQSYTYSASTIDNNNNIIATIEGKSLLIPASELEARYEEYKGSSLLYNEWVTRTVGYITKMVEKWYKSWH